jgi:hypothetical protein
MINELIKLANYLDSKGLSKEADFLDGIITKVHGKGPDEPVELESEDFFSLKSSDDCGQRLEDEAYYFEHLSEMLEDAEEEQEDEAHDMVDT